MKFVPSPVTPRICSNGALPIVDVNNNTKYAVARTSSTGYSWPAYKYGSVSTSKTSDGIVLGSGNTPVTLADHDLDARITSGLSCSVVETNGVDGNGVPYLNYDITCTNTSSDSITIAEIGLQQNVLGTNTQGQSSGGSSYHVLVERTVLDTPVTIAAGDYETIRYQIKASW